MIDPLARLGYASKALIYGIVGGLAAAAVGNRGGRVTDTSGALRVILSQPFGQAILIVLALGLCGYAAWRILDATMDPDRHGTDFGGLVVRIGNVIRGLIYGALGVEAFRLARGLRGSRGNEAELWTARVMDLPALHELRKACAERLRTEQATGHVRPDIDPVAVANGIVTISLSLLRSVVQIGSDDTVGYAEDVAAVFAAALDPVPPPAT